MVGPDFDLVRRLLLPPGWLGPRPYRLPEPDEAPEDPLLARDVQRRLAHRRHSAPRLSRPDRAPMDAPLPIGVSAMGEAALNIAGQERGGPDFDLVRRLLLPPGITAFITWFSASSWATSSSRSSSGASSGSGSR
jgi:hypothetical protein